MKLIFCSNEDATLFAAALKLIAGGAPVAELDPARVGFGSVPLAIAPGVADAVPSPIAPGAPLGSLMPPPMLPALVPPPAPVAPVPPESAAPSNVAPAGLDIHGLPWDHRIHAGTQSKNADGAWKKKKGIGETEYNAIAAELRQVMAIPAPVPLIPVQPDVAPPPLVPSAPVAPPAPPMMPPAPPAPVAPALAAPVVAPVAPPTPIAAPPMPAPLANTSAPATFPELMTMITGLVSAQRITQPEVLAACQACGVPGLPSLAPRPDLIPSVAATIQAMAKPAA